jgi:hypothetical protein
VTRIPDFPWRRLGELLIERGLVDADDLEEALAIQAATGRRLGEILVTHGALTSAELIAALAEQYGLEVRVGALAGAAMTAHDEWQPLGRILVERGSLGRAALNAAVEEQRRTGRQLGSILVDGGHVSPIELVEALVQQHGLQPHSLVAVATTPLSDEPGYHVVDGAGRALFRTDGFLEATDFAFELLETDEREAVAIVRVSGDEREEVWSYTEERAAEAAAARRDPLEIYGFDVARWTGPPRR